MDRVFLLMKDTLELDYRVNSSAPQEDGGEVVAAGLLRSQNAVTFEAVFQMAQGK